MNPQKNQTATVEPQPVLRYPVQHAYACAAYNRIHIQHPHCICHCVAVCLFSILICICTYTSIDIFAPIDWRMLHNEPNIQLVHETWRNFGSGHIWATWLPELVAFTRRSICQVRCDERHKTMNAEQWKSIAAELTQAIIMIINDLYSLYID